MAWGKEGSNTLTSSAGVVDVDATGTFIMAMMHDFATGGNTEVELRFDSTGGSAYARRNSSNGGSDNTAVSQASIQGHGATSDDDFHITYTVNIATEEKLMIGFGVNRNSAGAGNAPYREEFVGKYAQTSAKVETQGIIDTSGSGSYDTYTNLSVLGSDMTPAAAVPFPTNVQDNSIYIETDTAERYWYNGTSWFPTFQDHFNTDKGWAATGADVSVSTTDKRLDFNIPNTASQTDAITYDLTSVSDSAWVLRFKWVMDNYSQNTTGHAKKLLIGLSSAPNSTDVDSAQDAIGILFGSWDNGTHKIRSRDSDGGSWMGGSGTDFSEAFTDDEVYYVEIKRTSTTAYTVSLYSDSSYSTLIEAESETMASTIAGLRYLKVGIDTTGSTPSGTFTGYIDNVEFYNGVTSV